MKKIYARQVPPDQQESPLYLLGEWPAGVIVTGNRHYNSHTTPAFDAIALYLDEAADDLADIKACRSGWYTSATAYFNDVFTPKHKPGYSTKDVARWKRLAAAYEYNSPNRHTLICEALQLLTGQQYEYKTIRGCCQGDWQECYYPAQFGPAFIDAFEVEYFNTGTEWIVHDEENTPQGPEDITGYSVYCYTANPALVIAQDTGTTPENVVLYEFDGYTQTAKYKGVTAA